MHRVSVLLPTDTLALSMEEKARYTLLERTDPRGEGVDPLRGGESPAGCCQLFGQLGSNWNCGDILDCWCCQAGWLVGQSALGLLFI